MQSTILVLQQHQSCIGEFLGTSHVMLHTKLFREVHEPLRQLQLPMFYISTCTLSITAVMHRSVQTKLGGFSPPSPSSPHST